MEADEAGHALPEARRRWWRASLGAAVGLALLGAVWLALQDTLAAAALDAYPAPHWRRMLLRERIEGYGGFFLLAGLAAAIFAAALRAPPLPRATARGGRLARSRAGRVALASAAALGLLGLMYHYSDAEWERFGRPCWDDYCDYADHLRRWWFGDEPGAATGLLAFLRESYHANSPAGPVLTALLGGLTGLPTVTAYRAVSSAATLASLGLVGWGLLPHTGTPRPARAAALVLLASNLVLVRSAFFPQTDALVLLWTTALLALGLARLRAPRAWHGVACFGLLATGPFVKLSFLPALALLPVWSLAARSRALAPDGAPRRPTPWAAAREVALFSLAPAAAYLAFQLWLDTGRQFEHELRRMSTGDTRIAFHAMSLLHAGLVFGGLTAAGRARLGAEERLLLVWVGLYLLCLWASGASGWDRFYLPVLAPLAVTAAGGLAALREAGGARALWLLALLIASLNYAALTRGLYY